MSETVTLVKSRLGIAEVVGSYIKLEKAGANFRARCPFHNERTPSFIVSPTRNSYYCFGCNRGGDIFSFVQEVEGVEFFESLKILAARAGVQITFENPGARDERARLLLIPSNDSVFEGTAAAKMHQIMARARAIENDAYVARADKGGTTSVIDPYGRVATSTNGGFVTATLFR
jgi:DNA primase catalytic core